MKTSRIPDPSTATTRRTFLKKSLTVGGALMMPMIVPSRGLGLGGNVAPSNRIVIEGIAEHLRLYLLPQGTDAQATPIDCDGSKG